MLLHPPFNLTKVAHTSIDVCRAFREVMWVVVAAAAAADAAVAAAASRCRSSPALVTLTSALSYISLLPLRSCSYSMSRRFFIRTLRPSFVRARSSALFPALIQLTDPSLVLSHPIICWIEHS